MIPSSGADSQENGFGFDRLLTVEETADLMHVGRDKVFALIRTGRLQSIKLGRSRRIAPHHIRAMIEKETQSHI